jgi:signal transduction histidine kinase
VVEKKQSTVSADPRTGGRAALIASAAGLAVFAVVVALVTLTMRERLRAQIVARDAAVLNSVAALELERARALGASYNADAEKNEVDTLLGAMLDVSRLDGVVALRVFDADGNFVDAAPANFVRGGIGEGDMATLRLFKPVSRYHENADLGAFIYETGRAASPRLPLLEVVVPLSERGGRLIGYGQFLLDGRPAELAFRKLDENLLLQDALALLAAFTVGGGLVYWSYARLHKSNVLLAARTADLARANRELALRSRVAAVGSVTAHLLHGLKNPLASLSLYVEERRRNAPEGDEGLADANEAVARMGAMIEESVSILGQDAGGERFDYSAAEIEEVVLGRLAKAAREKGVIIRRGKCPEVQIDNMRGNLLALAASNLAQNAVEATPSGGSVSVDWSLEGDGKLCLRIHDTGPGLPEAVAKDPFRPVRSGKRTGSGVGMAIAAQLVRQMSGEIALEGTGREGSTFAITFPAKASDSAEDAE